MFSYWTHMFYKREPRILNPFSIECCAACSSCNRSRRSIPTIRATECELRCGSRVDKRLWFPRHMVVGTPKPIFEFIARFPSDLFSGHEVRFFPPFSVSNKLVKSRTHLTPDIYVRQDNNILLAVWIVLNFFIEPALAATAVHLKTLICHSIKLNINK